MGYDRVLPRDLFNEAKLLKCLGQLSLLIHEGKCSLTIRHDTTYCEGFNVQQDPSDGNIFVQNVHVRTKLGMRLPVCTTLNAKDAYPLVFQLHGTEYPLLTDNGQLTDEYFEYLHTA